MAALRDPATRCPWDILQTFASIAPYTLAQRKENRITVLPFDMPQPNRSLGILRRVSPNRSQAADRLASHVSSAFEDLKHLIKRHENAVVWSR